MRIHVILLAMTWMFACATPARSTGPAVDAAAVAVQADSFAIQVGGQPFGTQVVTVQRTGAGFHFRETTMTPVADQTTEVTMSEALAMRSVRQEGRSRGQAMRIDVTYADGRAAGSARVPGPDGMTDVTVDAAVPPDVVDDNVLTALLPGMPWEDGATFDVPVFASGKNTLTTHTLRVTGREEVTVPAGTFQAYRVEVTGSQPLVLHVRLAAPHTVLRIEVVGTPMTVVRTGAVR